MDRIADIFAGITMLAVVTTLVANRNTANIISSIGTTYAKSLRAAMGN